MVEKLPFRIRYERYKSYGVSMVSAFLNPDDIGSCDPNTKEIKIKAGLSDRLTVSSLTHEIIHLINFERDLGLTESQVEALEIGLFKVLDMNQDYLKLLYKTLLKRRSQANER